MMSAYKILALMFVASAAFGQNVMQIKIVRGEIRRDLGDLAANSNALRAARAELATRQKEELRVIKKSGASRVNRAVARRAVLDKYAALWSAHRREAAARRRSLQEDIASKKAWIQKLRRP